ncbi:MAG: hypothetical protein PUP91_27570 [Rhizonema sp. PD37]|nr:hypothetical protein [Rhizonema sp. PD37]
MQVQNLRGIQSFEVNDNMIFVQAPVASVGELFHHLYSGRWERDVYGREIQDVDSGFIMMQFQGHSWTIICEPNFTNSCRREEDAQTLSRLLNTRTICYYASDTCGEFSYEVYQAGTCVEKLVGDYDVGFTLESQLRSPEIIQGPHGFIDTFFREQGIYVPVLFYSLSLGKQINERKLIIKLYQSVIVDILDPERSVPFFQRSDFERVDFFALSEVSTTM